MFSNSSCIFICAVKESKHLYFVSLIWESLNMADKNVNYDQPPTHKNSSRQKTAYVFSENCH